MDEDQKKIAVQIDIADFEKIEQILEDYALGQLIEENDPKETLDLQEAKKFLKDLAKLPVNERQKIESFVFDEKPGIPNRGLLPLP